MGEYRLSPEAELDLDEIWLYIARASRSPDIATDVIEDITDRFLALALHPYIGRTRDYDLLAGLRSFSVGEYLIIYRLDADNIVTILHVMHGSRDINAFFRS